MNIHYSYSIYCSIVFRNPPEHRLYYTDFCLLSESIRIKAVASYSDFLLNFQTECMVHIFTNHIAYCATIPTKRKKTGCVVVCWAIQFGSKSLKEVYYLFRALCKSSIVCIVQCIHGFGAIKMNIPHFGITFETKQSFRLLFCYTIFKLMLWNNRKTETQQN